MVQIVKYKCESNKIIRNFEYLHTPIFHACALLLLCLPFFPYTTTTPHFQRGLWSLFLLDIHVYVVKF